jgi:hypothetical protein
VKPALSCILPTSVTIAKSQFDVVITITLFDKFDVTSAMVT